MQVCSFDVFDTLLTRVFAEPTDLFQALGWELQGRGLIDSSPEAFARLRVKAELIARTFKSNGEVNLEDIYQQLAKGSSWSGETLKQAKGLELALEQKSLRPIPGMLERVQDARKTADHIFFLSDMYLPAEFLQPILEREHFFQPGDRLFLSHESGYSKGCGSLYRHLLNRFPTISRWTHLGDHQQADVEMPRRLGINAGQFTGAKLSRYEQQARGKGSPVWRSKLAGAMRLARLAGPGKGLAESAIWDVGSDVAGPLLFGFVHWSLEQARGKGLKRLYFISRDGQILQRIAEMISAAWNYEVECRYLYGSRQAWHSAAIVQLKRDHLDWLMAPTRFLSARQVFERVGLTPKQVDHALEQAGWSSSDWDRNLDEPARRRLGDLLFSEPIRSAIEANAAEKRQMVLQYLRQEDVIGDAPAAIVDIGWHGNLQRSLTQLLQCAGCAGKRPLLGFYFGLLPETIQPGDQGMIGYWNRLPDPAWELKLHNTAMFEVFTAADHGSVLGYEDRDGRMHPLLDRPKNREALDWGLFSLHQSIVQFTSTCAEVLRPGEFSTEEYRRVIRKIYRIFYYDPTPEEAMVWGEFRFSDQQLERVFEKLAPDWNKLQLLKALVDYRKRPACWWPEGILARSWSWPLFVYLLLKKVKWRLFHESSFDS